MNRRSFLAAVFGCSAVAPLAKAAATPPEVYVHNIPPELLRYGSSNSIGCADPNIAYASDCRDFSHRLARHKALRA